MVVPAAIGGAPVLRIESGAFWGRADITTITIPASVVQMDNWAFEGALGGFDGCSGLSAIEVDPANRSYSSVDGVLFNKPMVTLLL